jgi:hypothetical protein
MEAFAPPDGVTNPGAGPIQGYGGTLVGDKLLQIGGGQDNAGGVPVVGGVAMPSSPQTVATGSFLAPTVEGEYTVLLETPIGSVYTELNAMPAISPVADAAFSTTGDESITFTVGTAGCACGDLDENPGPTNLGDFSKFQVCFGLRAPTAQCPQNVFDCCDLDGNGWVNLTDFSTFQVLFGTTSTNSVPNCP